MKVSTERNQRQLHRLTRRAQEALSHPAAAVLAAASKAMGFADLADADLAPGHIPNQDDPRAKKSRLMGHQDVFSPEQVCNVLMTCFCIRLLVVTLSKREVCWQCCDHPLWQKALATGGRRGGGGARQDRGERGIGGGLDLCSWYTGSAALGCIAAW